MPVAQGNNEPNVWPKLSWQHREQWSPEQLPSRPWHMTAALGLISISSSSKLGILSTHYGCVEEDYEEKQTPECECKLLKTIRTISAYGMLICCSSYSLSEYCEYLCFTSLKKVLFFLGLLIFTKPNVPENTGGMGQVERKRHFGWGGGCRIKKMTESYS